MIINLYRCVSSYIFEYSFDDYLFTHKLHVPADINPSDDSLALIAYFSRPKNDETFSFVGLQITKPLKDFLQSISKATIIVRVIDRGLNSNERMEEIPKNSFLAFSGGFDSIAADYVLGHSLSLVSISFGGSFTRESIFFTQFPTKIFFWELRGTRSGQDIRFNENTDWRFLLSPFLCLREQSSQLGIATGTILEASPYWFSGKLRTNFSAYSPNNFGPQTALICPVGCISEYGTTAIALRALSSQQLQQSLDSLAGPTSFKRYRKQVLICSVNNTTPPVTEALHLHKFGTSYGDDMVALYIAWKFGERWTKENYCRNIPDLKNLNMKFFEKVNSQNLKTIDQKLATSILLKMQEIGFSLTDSDDLNAIESASNLRNNFLLNLQPD